LVSPRTMRVQSLPEPDWIIDVDASSTGVGFCT
jgi:hypothetical protein